jgi:hypothetical protein
VGTLEPSGGCFVHKVGLQQPRLRAPLVGGGCQSLGAQGVGAERCAVNLYSLRPAQRRW